MIRLFIFSFLCLLLATPSMAQSVILTESIAEHLKIVSEAHQRIMDNLPKTDNYKKYKKRFEERNSYIITLIEEKFYLYDTPLNSYVNDVFETIIASNPKLQKNKYSIVINRSTSANALSRGVGIIEVNIRLLLDIENESQLAYILCHELAHELREDANKDMIKKIDKLYSDELKDKIKDIKKNEYNTHSQALDLYKDYVYEDLRHQRDHEVEADKLGFELYANTSYAWSEALSCMDMLDTLDYPKWKGPLGIKNFFHTTSYPFKEAWLTANSSFTDMKDTIPFIQDSIKTHPDCKLRKNLLASYQAKEQNHKGIINPLSIERYEDMKTKALNIYYESLLLNNEYDYALYHTLQSIQDSLVVQPYNYARAIYLLKEIIEAMVEHKLASIVRLPIYNPELLEHHDFNKLLYLIQNIRLSELKRIALNFAENIPTQVSNDEAVVKQLLNLYELCDPAQAEQYKAKIQNN